MHRGWKIAWKEWISHVMLLYLVYITCYHHWVLFKWNWAELEGPGQRVSNISELSLHVQNSQRLDTNTIWEIFVLISREVK